jgi:hypothetical protein
MIQTVWYSPELDELLICRPGPWPDTVLDNNTHYWLVPDRPSDTNNQLWLVYKYNRLYEFFFIGEL